MTVRVRDLSVIRAPGPPPTPAPVAALSVAFLGVFPNIALTPQTVVASGGTPPYTWSAVGLPAGVSINPLTGSISGTPTASGDTTATVTVTDADGGTIAVPAFFSVLQTAFADDFNRANSTAGFGDNWLYAGEPGATTNALIAGTWGISANAAIHQATAVNANFNRPLSWYAVPVMSVLRGQNQFAECRCTVNNSIVLSRQLYIGPSVLGAWQGGPDYRMYVAPIIIDDINNTIGVQRWNSGTGVFTDLGGFVGAVAIGDLVRMEATILAGQVDLEIFVNGVSIGVRSDAGATRSVDGSPGVTRWLYASSAVPGVPTVQWDDFACGVL